MRHYSSLSQLQERHCLLLPDREQWRLTPPYPRGHLRGLPETQGWLVCTTGVLCYVLLDRALTEPDESKQPMFLGHLDNFLADRPEQQSVVREHSAAPRAGEPRCTVEQLMLRYNI